MKKAKFAILLGSRKIFPSSLIADARKEIKEVLEGLGHEIVMLDSNETENGAVETPAEGRIFADFLKENKNRYDGIILTLPDFGSEGGIIAAIKDVDVPVFIHAYPDELDKLATTTRRDAFCGKFVIMNILRQYGVNFTAQVPHAVHPKNPEFKANIDCFSKVCLVTRGMKDFIIGDIGARTTIFKAVRFDEVALKKHGITVEALDAIALRCWTEVQEKLGISPCVLLSEMNERGFTATCETDVCSAVIMRA
jgi:L-fucose isomerase-like protein